LHGWAGFSCGDEKGGRRQVRFHAAGPEAREPEFAKMAKVAVYVVVESREAVGEAS
jgi:hypothetical protein